MRYGVHVNRLLGVKSRYLAVLGGIVLSALVACAPISANAEDSIIDVAVCQNTNQASLMITAPSQDVKVTSLPIAVSGDITLLSQIRVYLDDVYNATIPIDSGSASFTYNLTASPGKHTIRFEGVAICGTNPSQTLTLTYVPPQLPPVVGSVPAATNTSNATVSGAPIEVDKTGGEIIIGNIDVGGVVSDITYNSLVALDFATPESLASVPAMATRFALVTVGLTAVVFAVPLVRAAATMVPPRLLGIHTASKTLTVSPHAHHIVRIVGAIMFVIPIIWNS